mgnify:CR=1 FL=1
MNLYRDRYYRIDLHEPSQTLQFVWHETHPAVDYEGFVEACCNFIGYGFEYMKSPPLKEEGFTTDYYDRTETALAWRAN